MRDVKNSENNETALFKQAIELGHSIKWENYRILQIETDYHKCKFIESFYVNSLSNALNDKKSVFHLYTKICFRNIIFQFSRSSMKCYSFCVVRLLTILTALVLLIVSSDLVLLR